MSPALDSTTLSRIEDAGLNASAPPQQLWLDGWLLRLSPGKAKRARCINALATGRLPVADKLAEAAALFQAAGLPLVVRITPFSQPAGLDEQLASLGLQHFDDTCVLAGHLADMALHEALPEGLTVQACDAPTYARIVGDLRGSTAAQQHAHAQRLQQSPVPYQGWLLRDGRSGPDGEVLACAQYAQEAALVGLYDVFTAPAARNRGLARRLCADLLRRAQAAGARTAYLQVDAGNGPAIAAYRRLGFADGYRYHYRAADPSVA